MLTTLVALRSGSNNQSISMPPEVLAAEARNLDAVSDSNEDAQSMSRWAPLQVRSTPSEVAEKINGHLDELRRYINRTVCIALALQTAATVYFTVIQAHALGTTVGYAALYAVYTWLWWSPAHILGAVVVICIKVHSLQLGALLHEVRSYRVRLVDFDFHRLMIGGAAVHRQMSDTGLAFRWYFLFTGPLPGIAFLSVAVPAVLSRNATALDTLLQPQFRWVAVAGILFLAYFLIALYCAAALTSQVPKLLWVLNQLVLELERNKFTEARTKASVHNDIQCTLAFLEKRHIGFPLVLRQWNADLKILILLVYGLFIITVTVSQQLVSAGG